MKKTILILSAVAIGIVLALVVAYIVAVKSAKKETLGESIMIPKTFTNPTNQPTENVSSSESTFITITGGTTTTGTSTILSFVSIPSSIVIENADPATPGTVLIVESVGQSDDGTVIVSFKILTRTATKTASVDPGELLKIVDFSRGNIAPRVLEGGDFRNIAPNSEISGNAVFFLDDRKSSVILQVGKDGSAGFYEFDFIRKTYRSAQVG